MSLSCDGITVRLRCAHFLKITVLQSECMWSLRGRAPIVSDAAAHPGPLQMAPRWGLVQEFCRNHGKSCCFRYLKKKKKKFFSESPVVIC